MMTVRRFRRRALALALLLLSGGTVAAEADVPHSRQEQVTVIGVEDVHRGAWTLEGRRVSVCGYLREVFADETTTNRLVAILKHSGDSAYLSFQGGKPELAHLRKLVSAKIVVQGTVSSRSLCGRRFEGPRLEGCSLRDVTVLASSAPDAYSAKLLEENQPADPKHINALLRRRLIGEVLAVWGRKFLLRGAGESSYSALSMERRTYPVGSLHVVELAPEQERPRPGSWIETVGFPVTDLYGVNFLSAIWRETPPACNRSCADTPTSAEPSLLRNGGLLTFSGTVTDVIREGTPELDVRFATGDVRVPLDACPEVCDRVAVGSRLSLTGRCVVERENWHGYATYPRVRKILVVPRTAADVVVLSGPAWWTPARLLAIIGGLLLLVVAMIVKWAVDRRIAAMRFADRTRLAVELHDSISQNLTGVSLQIDAARELVAANPDRLIRRLDVASRTVDSCREQMRNCIGDLRGNLLDCDNLNRAIREILKPILQSARLRVRFAVPRRALSDASAHAVFSIVRELVANAVRHGGASSIRVAGALERGCLRFSVADDGCGFDPDCRPGIEDGHFGLQGVGERVRALSGRFTIRSVPGKGTHCAVMISRLKEP